MFGDEFFPTPKELIRTMIEPYMNRIARRSDGAREISSILEPSAGDGAIVEEIRENLDRWNQTKIRAIEISLELAAILNEKKIDVVANDFLTYWPEHRIDLIVMNPPFSNGVEHLLHAWEIANGTEIVCLLSAANITNPHTREMELLRSLIEEHGSVEMVGRAFSEARRETEIEVAMIRLTKPEDESKTLNFDFEAGDDIEDRSFALNNETSETGVQTADQLGAMIRMYEKTKEAYTEYLRAKNKLAFYGAGMAESRSVLDIAEKCHGRNPQEHYEKFCDDIRVGFWDAALRKIGMEKCLTSALQQKFRDFVEQQGKMALTKENIGRLMDTIMLNRHSIMGQAVEQVFDHMTKYHERNRVHVEGWKTNEAWKVGKKVILPFFVEKQFSSGFVRLSHHRSSEARDIDKVMCYLSGKRIEDIVSIEKAISDVPKNQTAGESTFFKMRCFAGKGTIHLEFKDQELLDRFNTQSCKGKGWIGHEK